VIEIGVDIGGTFTDVVLVRDGRIAHFTKVPTTSSDPIGGVRAGVERALTAMKIEPSEVDRFVHGSTVAINALIQKKGAVTGLLATQGFEDTLEIGRHKRSRMYELFLEPETPAFLAPRRRRRGIPERVAADGSVVTPLEEDAVRRAVADLVSQGATALAVSYLFSFRNPQHERRTREVIREIHPDLHVSLSSEVDPAFREYERTVITTLDAYLHGAVGDYIARLRAELERMGFSAKLQVMQSRGGITNAESIMARPLALLLSGLAAGVIGSRHVAVAARQRDVISLDMGGTSCDIALIRSGTPILTNQTRVAHYPIRMQMVDVNTIGAGGGSIAWVDGAGGLRVGPHSAGAEPGPACYQRGGQEATVTDASLVLGYLNPDAFAGGIRPDMDLAKAAIKRVADRVGLSLVATAAGIHRIVNARMNDEVRRVSVQRGYDPREFSLLPLGGGGPVHGSAIALDLGMANVIVPDTAGVLSAFGLLVANIEHDQMETFGQRADRADPAAIEDIFKKLIALGQSKMAADGIAADRVDVRRQADMRYTGQSYELTIELASDAADQIKDAVDRFHDRHKDLYGHSNPGAPVELVNLRTVHVHHADSQTGRYPGPIADAAPSAGRSTAPITHREAYFDAPGAYVRTPIYDRRSMAAGVTIEGPAIIEQPDTTVVVHPSQRASMRADRSLLIEVGHEH
jgi:N-methylhydantoinase A